MSDNRKTCHFDEHLVNRVNGWNTLRASGATAQPVTADANAEKTEDWAISRQAARKRVEGSTSNPRSLSLLGDMAVKGHERAGQLVH